MFFLPEAVEEMLLFPVLLPKMFFVFKVRVITLIPFKFDVVKKKGGSEQCLYAHVSIFLTSSIPPRNNEPEVKEKGSVSCTPHWFQVFFFGFKIR